ncbi:16S rRNA (cytosine(1402)-N(4))-methyltransferase RsmH [endosymbiont of unidentified scaly snail isolate Monju]|uniref:16S rRNA (cytosine(1402)-N(4))-methyltransferase RsmH n=1 Tax=endosymbiont of unidentified scaly snail isolate Monju TaxID=1248727 RepID=UPI0003892653|nr:16S rRNA (cytosine(1402)-N(4))-methyltransferase RsmH [endosymbiont of unidentified scaly snail isolate Monju]BAN68394.1 16S rRNA (cytosine1402-N4)-methyltransferase [endosymbiont of unidentified scaly snail isolate Monju]
MNDGLGEHRPVLLEEAVTALAIKPEGVYVDGTFGRGGHSRVILERLGPAGQLIGFDKDEAALNAAQRQFANEPRLRMVHGSFARLAEVARAWDLVRRIDGVLLDLGVSSPQLDAPERGFSFQHDGPLDMRMDRSTGESAADWLAYAEEEEIARVIREYGEERFARRIARTIVRERVRQPLRSTAQLAALVASAVPRRDPHKHPATRTFQAIRIHINSELDDLRRCLSDALDVLAVGARLVVISFHSLEDRIVKHFLRDQARGPRLPKGVPVQHEQVQGRLRLIGKAVRPGEAEVAANPRARSAVMRVAEVLA